ncbi:MAG: hypothetical protein FWF13_06200 [Acidobacteria bacterium]|nr:hypothetical protein [Acidobacteriota bacterium]
MPETEIPDYPRGITFEQVWAGLMENRKQMEETDRLIRETQKEMRETGRRMGYLSNRFGELAEHLVAPGIGKRFNELGYRFESMASRGCEVFGDDGKVKTEIDILLENGETLIAVEVKSKPSVKDAEHHIKRLEILREARNRLHDKRKIMGAIAGAVFGAKEKDAACQAGLYVIEQSGDTMKIDMPQGFIPREW